MLWEVLEGGTDGVLGCAGFTPMIKCKYVQKMVWLKNKEGHVIKNTNKKGATLYEVSQKNSFPESLNVTVNFWYAEWFDVSPLVF